ncbi:uncharacterized protein LOC142982793 [Anticarsia gemmatalis]|uniref:uncharacterized protein LOC142982793 n=1 Tax=Anticarsia gemmatalis TaxID=129554 RepID=UPI003F770B93
MDVSKLLKEVNSLNEYISVTHDASDKCKSSRIQLNMSTVLALKKIRSLEIEHVDKCEENGIATVIFERMLNLPSSKTWGVLSKEMVSLLQYWLDAVRKHLVKHSPCWWTFLKLLLRFVKEIRQKDSSVPNILVEDTAECLLDLATTEGPDAMQRYEILHCFNMYCSESSREIRFALRSKLGQYFTKLSTYMSGCGHLPCQYSIMETLLRWLLPRQDRMLRITSATKWFPHSLYADSVVDIFLHRPWMNFFQDARDFLNAHNERSDLITSVVCRKLSVGDIVIIANTEKTDCYLDINSTTKCMSVLLDPRVLDAFGSTNHKSFETFVVAADNTNTVKLYSTTKCMSVLLDPRVLDAFGSTNHKSFETFVVTADNTNTVKLYRESQVLSLSIETVTPPAVLPSCIKLGEDMSCEVNVVLSSHCDLKRLDNSLTKVFGEKYQLLLDLDKEVILSPKEPEHTTNNAQSEDIERFSHPVEVRRRKHSGYMVRHRQPASCQSPSTASTSSLAQLHEKLAALPRYKFDKEPQSVCALPELSIVSEGSETEERTAFTLNYKPYGVCYNTKNALDTNRRSQSDNEIPRNSISTSKGRRLSPIVHEDAPSCLLVATIGSDDAVINETVERLSKSKDYNPDNIVDLLVQEALNAKQDRDKDSGINTGEKKSLDVIENCDAIENTPDDKITKISKRPKVVSSTSDESNTEAFSDTPNVYVTTRKRTKAKVDTAKTQSFDVDVVEKFFSQHFTENDAGAIIISPTLAKKINETSSDSSDHLENLFLVDDNLRHLESNDLDNIEIIECLNNMIDRVCYDFDICKYFNETEPSHAVVSNPSDSDDNLPLKHIKDKATRACSTNKETAMEPINPKEMEAKKLSSIHAKKHKGNKVECPNNQKTNNPVSMENSARAAEDNIVAHSKENVENNKNEQVTKDTAQIKTPLMKRKRKLYSPKDEQLAQDSPVSARADIEEDYTDGRIKKTPKSTSAYKPYKDIEIERQRHIRMPRNRTSKQLVTPSPRSKKMNELFEQVKESANGEHVTLVEKASEVYNFSSDSEDNFQQKKIDVSKKNNNTNDGNSAPKRRQVQKRSKAAPKGETKNAKKKTKTRRKTNRKLKVEPAYQLVDEKMRNASVELEMCVPVGQTESVVMEPEYVAVYSPEMEPIAESDESNLIAKTKRAKKSKENSVTRVNYLRDPLNIDSNDGSESPLPGLVVEEALNLHEEDGELSAGLVNKFRRIIQNQETSITESNTTHNLLSDNERPNYSLPIIPDEILQTELGDNHYKDIESHLEEPIESQRPQAASPTPVLYVIEVAEDNDSDDSMGSLGINGHGDSCEAPPNLDQMNERFQPRDLHTEDMDSSTKKYFEKLTNEIDEINQNESIDGASSPILSVHDQEATSAAFLKSPVVSVKRLSLEDIRQYLPSNRNSDSDQTPDSTQSSKRARATRNKAPKYNDDKTNDSVYSQPLLIRRNASKSANRNVTTRKSGKKVKSPNARSHRQQKCTPRSIISPIKMYDCSVVVDKLSENLSSDEEVIERSENDNTQRAETSNGRSVSANGARPTVPYKLRSASGSNQSRLSSPIVIHDSRSGRVVIKREVSGRNNSVPETVSTPTRIRVRPAKRSLEKNLESYERENSEENNNSWSHLSKRERTAVNLDDWFRRGEQSSGEVSAEIKTNIEDATNIVLEKLETTLSEMNRHTSRQLAQLFACTQKQLTEHNERTQQLYKNTAADIISNFIKILDRSFYELKKKTEAQNVDIFEQFKENSAIIIGEDCKRKNTMVQLLKEDVRRECRAHVSNAGKQS